MDEFNVFGDCSTLSDDAIFEQINRLNEMISYYYMTNYSYLVPQLQTWRDQRLDMIYERTEKRRMDKMKNKDNPVIFDNSTEVLDAAKEAAEKEKIEKENLLKPKK